MNDPAVLRRRIAELEIENKKLKENESGNPYALSKGLTTMRAPGL